MHSLPCTRSPAYPRPCEPPLLGTYICLMREHMGDQDVCLTTAP